MANWNECPPETKPCPFCGGAPELCFEYDDIGDWKVACRHCGACSCPIGIRYDKQLAIDDWNSRINGDRSHGTD